MHKMVAQTDGQYNRQMDRRTYAGTTTICYPASGAPTGENIIIVFDYDVTPGALPSKFYNKSCF